MTAPTPDLDLQAIRHEMESNPRDPMEERIGRRKLLLALAAVTAERDQARQMLADAPHMENCCWDSAIQPRCTCWKAGL